MPLKRVIITDDALDLGRMLKATLAAIDASLNVTVVPSAEEAMLETARITPDLLVTDVRLPGMSGVDMVRKVRARHPSLPIIVISGLKEDDLEARAAQAGANRFFAKPLPISDFIAAVLEMLGLPPEQVLAPADPARQPAVSHPTTRPPSSHALPPSFPSVETDRTTSGENGTAAAAITNLRQRLDAQVVLLVDERGNVAARAGDFEDPDFETQSLPIWMAALSAGARAARLLGSTAADNAQAYRWDGLELVLAPIGRMALVIALKAGRHGLRLALAVEEALAVQTTLRDLLGIPELMLTPEAAAVLKKTGPLPALFSLPQLPDEAPAESEQDLNDLENLFGRPTRTLSLPELDSYWDQAAGTARPGDIGTPGALSFEQAQRLGLAPRDE